MITWEVAEAQKTTAQVAEEVQVERVIATLVQGALHVVLSGAAVGSLGPLVIGGEGGIQQVEFDTEWSVLIVHHGNLMGQQLGLVKTGPKSIPAR